MSELLKKHERVGKVLSAAFKADEEPMVEWAEIALEISDLQKNLRTSQANEGALQACIDRLMLEYCPDDMTEEQYNEWASHQVPVDVPEFDDFIKELKTK